MAVLVDGLLAVWWQRPHLRRASATALLAVTIVTLLGAATAMLPLAAWPWDPDQTLGHYLAHAL
ncbi:MAG: hypothetical protein H0V32_10225 [Nocardioidaceae bacterium]|nr:hypothetical protein [Nocardioidaceae bacterium]